MVSGHVRMVRHGAERLSYDDAVHIAGDVRRRCTERVVLLDLASAADATTAAFARLIVLRRNLRKSGGDLHLVGLRGRARDIYEVHRMGRLLPCETNAPAWAPSA